MGRERTTYKKIAAGLGRHPELVRRLEERGGLLAHAEREPGKDDEKARAHYFLRPVTPLPTNRDGSEAFINPKGMEGAELHVPFRALAPEVGLTIFDRVPEAPGPSIGVLGKNVVSGGYPTILVPRPEPGVQPIAHDEQEWARLCERAAQLVYAGGGYPLASAAPRAEGGRGQRDSCLDS